MNLNQISKEQAGALLEYCEDSLGLNDRRVFSAISHGYSHEHIKEIFHYRTEDQFQQDLNIAMSNARLLLSRHMQDALRRLDRISPLMLAITPPE